jgi:hypothetical protein
MKLLPVLLGAALLLSGCAALPVPQEMGEMALLRTMGVDAAEEGWSVAVSTGAQADEEVVEALALSVHSASLSGAALAIQGASDRTVSFGHLDQLLVGEELARRGVVPVLDYFVQNVELGLGTNLWVVRGSEACAAVDQGGQDGVERRLTTLQTERVRARTVGEGYADLLELGATYLPALVLEEGQGETLREGGYAVLKGETLAGFLTEEQAQGLELLAGGALADVLEVELDGRQVAVRVTASQVRSRFRSAEGGLSLHCQVTVRLAEHHGALSQNEREQVQAEIEARERERILSALTQLRAWEADCLGLGAKAALTAPGIWSGVQSDWLRVFGALEPEVAVQVQLLD